MHRTTTPDTSTTKAKGAAHCSAPRKLAQFSDVCQELESLARDGATDGAADLIGKMETEYERARTELEALRKTMA